MKIRDSRAAVNGNFETQEMPSGALEIVGDDGRSLFSVRLNGAQLEVSAGGICVHEGMLLNDGLLVAPRYANQIAITRAPHVTQ